MPELNDSIHSSILRTDDLAQRLSREAYVLAVGTIGGAVREAVKHPLETIGETAAMGVAAVGLTAVAAAELPLISVVAKGSGVVYGGGYVWNLIDPNSEHNIERNLALKSAVSTAWTTSDRGRLENSIENLQDKSGQDTLQVFQALIAGGAAAKYGARTAELIGNMPGNMIGNMRGDMPAAFALDGVAPSWFKTGADATVPTWDDYVNFNRRHGPVTTKTVHQFELEKIVRAAREATAGRDARPARAGENQTAAANSAARDVTESARTQTEFKATTQEADRSQTGDDTNGRNSQRAEREDTSDRTPDRNGNSLYFSHRFGSFHK